MMMSKPLHTLVEILLLLFLSSTRSSSGFVPSTGPIRVCHHPKQSSGLYSFYGNFEGFGDDEEDDDNDDDDDEDEYDDFDDATMAKFRSRMDTLFGEGEKSSQTGRDDVESTSSVDELISFATGRSTDEAPTTDWAWPAETLKSGVILVANPGKFCTDFGSRVSHPSPALLSKFGLSLPPPADLGPDRRADLLPVLTLLDHGAFGSRAVLMNRRTGYLLGDLEQPPSISDDGVSTSLPPPKLGAFMIQPLWYGGTASSSAADESAAAGLDMLHLCPIVDGAKQLTEDGLYWGGDPAQAQEVMNDPSLERVMTGFDFKFFVQSTRWLPLQLEKEIRDEVWFVAHVSKEVLFKPRDRMGTRRAKPLWTEIMELMGGKYREIRDQLYKDD